MIGAQNISLPRQAQNIYNLLLTESTPLTVAEIGRRLKIFPNAAYRSLETLEKLGCIVRRDGYPVAFQTVAPNEAVERFSLLIRENFLQTFNSAPNHREDLRVSFVKDRAIMLKKYALVAKRAKREIALIISGHELPAEVYLENLKAVRRGVKIRAIVQCLNKANRDIISSWQECGIDVRHLHFASVRLIVIDRQIVHLLSYSRKESLSGQGVEIVYPPFAEMMTEIFENNWRKAKPILLQ